MIALQEMAADGKVVKMTRLKLWLRLLVVAGCTGALYGLTALADEFPSLEVGTSPNPVGSGARAMGQGNAFIAVADDATAASWNPGGLSQLERPEISFALQSLWRGEDTTSGSHPESAGTGDLSLQDFNYASIAYPFFFGRNMVLSLNYLKLYGFDKTLAVPYAVNDPNGLGVDMKFKSEQEGAFSVIAPAFGMDVTEHLALGITLNIWNNSLTQSSSFSKRETNRGTVSWNTLAGQFMLDSKNNYEVNEGYSAVLGGLYRVNKEWAIGAVVKPPFVLDIDHDSSQTYSQTGDLGEADSLTHKQNHGRLSFPLIAGLGTAWRPTDALTISTDVTWTDWSSYKYRENGQDMNPSTGLPVENSRLEDTFTWRLGEEYLLIFDHYIVPLRAGVGYDPAPGVGEVDDFYTASLGTGLQFNRLVFDIAYEARWGNDVNRAVLAGFGGSQDVLQHRVLASMIVYF